MANIEIKKNGEVITSTSDGKAALISFATACRDVMESEDEGKVSVEMIIPDENHFVRITKEQGKIDV